MPLEGEFIPKSDSEPQHNAEHIEHTEYSEFANREQSSPSLTIAQIERLIDAKLAAQRLEAPKRHREPENIPTYPLKADRPGEFRWISDISIEEANKQLACQGLKIVRG